MRLPNTSSRNIPDGRSTSNGLSRRQSFGGADNITKLTSNGFLSRRSPSFQLRSSGTSTMLKHAKGTSKSFDGGTRSLDEGKSLLTGSGPSFNNGQLCEETRDTETNDSAWKTNVDDKPTDFAAAEKEETVPVVLYDLLQKEVLSLRKASHEKDQNLKDKNDAIEVDLPPSDIIMCQFFIFSEIINFIPRC